MLNISVVSFYDKVGSKNMATIGHWKLADFDNVAVN